jgi:hypothetical protein
VSGIRGVIEVGVIARLKNLRSRRMNFSPQAQVSPARSRFHARHC